MKIEFYENGIALNGKLGLRDALRAHDIFVKIVGDLVHAQIAASVLGRYKKAPVKKYSPKKK